MAAENNVDPEGCYINRIDIFRTSITTAELRQLADILDNEAHNYNVMVSVMEDQETKHRVAIVEYDAPEKRSDVLVRNLSIDRTG